MKNNSKILIFSFLFTGIIVTFTSCRKKDAIPPAAPVIIQTPVLTLGQFYQGGIVYYILKPGDPGYDTYTTHGLIADSVNIGATLISDPGVSYTWSNGSYSVTGAAGQTIGSGYSNTNKIVDSLGTGTYAAKLCYDLVLGGYSDWYLPNVKELSILFDSGNYQIINGFLPGQVYWTSNEVEPLSAMSMHFDGPYSALGKNCACAYVRAIRSF